MSHIIQVSKNTINLLEEKTIATTNKMTTVTIIQISVQKKLKKSKARKKEKYIQGFQK